MSGVQSLAQPCRGVQSRAETTEMRLQYPLTTSNATSYTPAGKRTGHDALQAHAGAHSPVFDRDVLRSLDAYAAAGQRSLSSKRGEVIPTSGGGASETPVGR